MCKNTRFYPRTLLVYAFAALALLGLYQASAHTRGENYIFLEFHPDSIDGRFEFRYDELKEKLGVDILSDGEASPELLQRYEPKVHEYIRERFEIGPDEDTAYQIEFTKATLFNAEGGWAQYEFVIDTGPTPPFLTITHNMCYENDRTHRGLIVIEKGTWPDPEYELQISMIFSARNKTQILDVRNPPELMTPARMIWQGILHIWIGIDHILFLLALALPIVLVKQGGSWVPAPKLGASLWSLVRIVTVFTIAHSITLALASLEIITLPSRFVESVIALSIILVALNNVLGRSQNTSLFIILFLGLFHGLGFASVMADLPFRIAELKELILIIIGFNVGVEIGQLAILVIVFPILYSLRHFTFYTPLILKAGSLVLALIAGYWFVERAFAL